MDFRPSLSDSKCPYGDWILSILADLNNVVVWMVSICPLISKSSRHCTNLLATVPSAPVTIGITVIFIFHSFFSSLARFMYLSLFSFFSSFTLWSAETEKSTIRQVPYFCCCCCCCCWLSRGPAEIRWSICTSKPQRILCVSFPRTDSGLCKYHLFVWSNLSFLQNS